MNSDMITKEEWEFLFPQRWGVGEDWKLEYIDTKFYQKSMKIDYYSYENFTEAVNRMGALGAKSTLEHSEATVKDKLRERAAFLAHISHETTNGEHALYYREELVHERHEGGEIELYRNVGNRTDFKCSDRPVYFKNCAFRPGEIRFKCQSYHGRGPIQLTWAYNYGLFSEFVFGNPDKLLQNPDLLLEDGVLGFMSAIWVWITEMNGRPSPLHLMYPRLQPGSRWGFGLTIMAINADQEADAEENGPNLNDQLVTNRIRYYRKYAEYYDVSVGSNGEKLNTKGLHD